MPKLGELMPEGWEKSFRITNTGHLVPSKPGHGAIHEDKDGVIRVFDGDSGEWRRVYTSEEQKDSKGVEKSEAGNCRVGGRNGSNE